MDKLFPYNEEVEKQLAQAKRILHASMNGVTSEGMSVLGYELNYGVSIMRIREIADGFSKSALLAQRCWWSSCRELMIFGTLVYPREAPFTEKDLDEWTEKCFNMELCEQLVFNLLSRRTEGDYASADMAVHLLNMEESHRLICGYLLCAQLFKRETFTQDLLHQLVACAERDKESESFGIYSVLAKALQSLVRIDRNLAEKTIQSWEKGKCKSTDYILEEVETELLY